MAGVVIRDIREEDTDFVFKLIGDLADHVGERKMFSLTLDDVRRDAFGPQRHFETLVAEADGRLAGISTWFYTYSTYVGKRCLFVNDLIVDQWARGYDVGRCLMARMATIAVANDCCRIDLHVHVENNARGFYKRIGMTENQEVPCMLRGDNLAAIARLDSSGI